MGPTDAMETGREEEAATLDWDEGADEDEDGKVAAALRASRAANSRRLARSIS